jgi:hypothetical protein
MPSIAGPLPLELPPLPHPRAAVRSGVSQRTLTRAVIDRRPLSALAATAVVIAAAAVIVSESIIAERKMVAAAAVPAADSDVMAMPGRCRDHHLTKELHRSHRSRASANSILKFIVARLGSPLAAFLRQPADPRYLANDSRSADVVATLRHR